MEQRIFSVSDLSQEIKQHVETEFASVRVRGEISSYKQHTSGHHYLSLKDQNAVIDAICWRGTHLSCALQDGLEIIATGRVTTYPSRSKYQMIIEHVLPAGQGELQALLKERYKKFNTLGYFDNKKPLPLFPKRIGIVTSPTGAVIRDILHRLTERYPCHAIVWPVLVQGVGSAEQISAAIRGFNQQQDIDVIIVARGGGSLEDLWSFNEEEVIEAVHVSRIPIISAIGHETDNTLIDYVADKRAPTPTAAAEMVAPVRLDILCTIGHYAHRMNAAILHYMGQRQLLIGSFKLVSPRRILEDKLVRLDDLLERIVQSIRRKLQRHQTQVCGLILRAPQLVLRQNAISMLYQRIKHRMQNTLLYYRQALAYARICLEQTSIEKNLQRGFCIPLGVDNKILNKKYVLSQTAFQLRFYDGTLQIKSDSITEVLNKK